MGARGVDLNSRTSDGDTPLHLAVKKGKVEVVQVRCCTRQLHSSFRMMQFFKMVPFVDIRTNECVVYARSYLQELLRSSEVDCTIVDAMGSSVMTTALKRVDMLRVLLTSGGCPSLRGVLHA